MGCFMAVIATDRRYDTNALVTATEKVVVDGNRRKYMQLGRTLRFYGGTTSATKDLTSYGSAIYDIEWCCP